MRLLPRFLPLRASAGGLLLLIGLVTVSIGESSPGWRTFRSGRRTAQRWGISVIESGEIPVILSTIRVSRQAGRQAGQQLPTLAGTHALQKPPKLDDLLAAPLCVAESHALPPRSGGRRGAGAYCPVPCYLTSAVPLDIDGRS